MHAILLIITLALLAASPSHAWSGRGHHTICEAATFVVKDKTLRNFLTTRLHLMGHPCNTPDIYWKTLGPDIMAVGNPGHFLDSEVIGVKIADIPLDFREVIRLYEGKPSAVKNGNPVFSIPKELGSSWWRADQFFRRAVQAGEPLKTASPPSNPAEEQKEDLPFNQATYDFMINAGLMGHFIGDMSQPFHATYDYDGYSTGHGGIHGFYEDQVVAIQPFDLTSQVVTAALQLRQTKAEFLKPGKSVAYRMRDLTILTFADLPKVYALDPVIKKSELKEEKGMQIKTRAERRGADTVAKKYRPLVVSQMARSAALLALLWEEAYEQIGRPPLAAYRSYRYPYTTEFVPPDYYDISAAPKKNPHEK